MTLFVGLDILIRNRIFDATNNSSKNILLLTKWVANYFKTDHYWKLNVKNLNMSVAL